MKRKLIILFWLTGIFFPASWLREYSTEYRTAFDAVFAPEWMHILSHLALFAGLGVMLAVSFLWSGRRWLITAGLLVGVGVLQEGIQALSSGNLLPNALFDVGVDLAGGMAGLGAVLGIRGWRRRSSAHTGSPGSLD